MRVRLIAAACASIAGGAVLACGARTSVESLAGAESPDSAAGGLRLDAAPTESGAVAADVPDSGGGGGGCDGGPYTGTLGELSSDQRIELCEDALNASGTTPGPGPCGSDVLTATQCAEFIGDGLTCAAFAASTACAFYSCAVEGLESPCEGGSPPCVALDQLEFGCR
jgi:hypothetical protein